ncbi:hypothetical protein [Asanoa siamensis]|uniref:Uncharacterized protein n=1 Tax=Asanoa siamensis TaxID=926357 RepID=A0ABQ4CRA4_9ACTN|nr:hypothetical protein [Asanoa siamensis]GIF73814.1 hypothetical protein Asi02nite_33320 [Asanoa siamensis]
MFAQQQSLAQVARRRVLYTGEPQAHAIADLRSRPDVMLPTIDQERTRFAGLVFEQVVRAGGNCWAHPFGVKGVWHERGKVIIALDHHTVFLDRTTQLMSSVAVDNLLPYLQPDVEVSQVPGLRVQSIAGKGGRDLHLIERDGSGHLVLRGSRGTNWRAVLAKVEDDTRAAGFLPLWNQRVLTAEEAAERPSWIAFRGDALWRLGSDLFQRINLFYSVSSAYTTSSWVTGSRWIIEMSTMSHAWKSHASFVSVLTDPHFGLKLELAKMTCRCDEADPHTEWQCRFNFHPAGSRDAMLELRFVRELPGPDDDWRDSFEKVGAASAWLDRVLPRRRSVGDGVSR